MSTPTLELRIEGDNAFLEYRTLVETHPERIIQVSHLKMGALPGGMKSGAVSLAFFVDLPDGRVVFAETSLRLLRSAMAIIEAKYPSPL